MADAIDSSILIAALAEKEDHHSVCLQLLLGGNCIARTHAFLETFSTLTGGRLPERYGAAEVAEALQGTVVHWFDSLISQPRRFSMQCGRRNCAACAVEQFTTTCISSPLASTRPHGSSL